MDLNLGIDHGVLLGTAKLSDSRLNIVISALQPLGINRQYSAPELAWPYIY
jgi:hypothetical protein